MRKVSTLLSLGLLMLVYCTQFGCNQGAEQKPISDRAEKQLSAGDLITRGRYIVNTSGCNDCHSPKIFTAAGPAVDSTRLLSGHPASVALMPFDKKVLQPGNWILNGPDLTSFVGPFGISFSSNLTPDTSSGIGAWTEEVFIKSMRTGKHLGQDGGRPILPPMPWYNVAQYTDEDLKSIFAYLKALPPIKNSVPAPVSPGDLFKKK